MCTDMVYIHVQSVCRLIHSSDLSRSICAIFDAAGIEVSGGADDRRLFKYIWPSKYRVRDDVQNTEIGCDGMLPIQKSLIERERKPKRLPVRSPR